MKTFSSLEKIISDRENNYYRQNKCNKLVMYRNKLFDNDECHLV